jgi:hypothetical protein
VFVFVRTPTRAAQLYRKGSRNVREKQRPKPRIWGGLEVHGGLRRKWFVLDLPSWEGAPFFHGGLKVTRVQVLKRRPRGHLNLAGVDPIQVLLGGFVPEREGRF